MTLEEYHVEETRTIIIPRNDKEANLALQWYVIDGEHSVIGLDCKWETKGVYDVAVIQISTAEHVILFQVCRFETEYWLPDQLSSILLNDGIVKVGVDIEEVVVRIRRQFQISVKSWLDLRCLAVGKESFSPLLIQQLQYFEYCLEEAALSDPELKVKRSGFMPKLSLQQLVEDILHRRLIKQSESEVDWEIFQLSQSMKTYAAADVAASLDVFLGLDEERHRNLRDSDYSLECLSESSNDVTWRSVIEKPFHQKEVRQTCLDMLAEHIIPTQQSILTDYYGRSSRRKIEPSNKPLSPVPQDTTKTVSRDTNTGSRDTALVHRKLKSSGSEATKEAQRRNFETLGEDAIKRFFRSLVILIKGFFRSLFYLIDKIDKIMIISFLALGLVAVIGIYMETSKNGNVIKQT